jgi:hypothetical protein
MKLFLNFYLVVLNFNCFSIFTHISNFCLLPLVCVYLVLVSLWGFVSSLPQLAWDKRLLLLLLYLSFCCDNFF